VFRRRKLPKKAGEGENPFLLSFSDFMASLLAIFILIVIVEVVQLKKTMESKEGYMPVKVSEYKSLKDRLAILENAVNELISKMSIFDSMQVGIDKSLNKVGERRKALETIITQIQVDLARQGVAVTPDIANLCLRFRDDENGETAPKKLLFALGSSDIPNESKETAAIIGSALWKALSETKNQRLIDTVFIEGHTDSLPNREKMGNWGLSAQRAISLWLFWTENPGAVKQLKELKSYPEQGDPRPMISVSGYADTRSTFSDEQLLHRGEDRPDDRRIEIRFTLAPSGKEGLEDVQSSWNNVLHWFPEEIQRLRKILNSD